MSIVLHCPVCRSKIAYSKSFLSREDILNCDGFIMKPKDGLLEPMFVPLCNDCYEGIRDFIADVYDNKNDKKKPEYHYIYTDMDKINECLRKDEEK